MRTLERVCLLDDVKDLDNLPKGSIIYLGRAGNFSIPGRLVFGNFAFYCGQQPSFGSSLTSRTFLEYESEAQTNPRGNILLTALTVHGDTGLSCSNGRLILNISEAHYNCQNVHQGEKYDELISRLVKLGLIPTSQGGAQ